MTLQEISLEYAETARQLSALLRTLRQRLRSATDPEEAWRLRQRIATLSQILTQTRELCQLTAHYYERGFWRNEKYTL